MGASEFVQKVALRYLWSQRSEAFIAIITVVAVLGVAIGVVVLTMTMAIMTGFEYELRQKVVGSTHILVNRLSGKIEHWEAAAEKVRAIPGVKSVSAYTQHQALLTLHGNARGLVVRGVQPGSSAAKEMEKYLDLGPDQGDLFSPKSVVSASAGSEEEEAQLPVLFVGRQLARQLSLFTGEPISLLSPQVGSTPFGMIPRFRRFVVGGIYQSGMTGYEEGLAYTSLDAAQKFFRLGSAVSGLEVMVNDITSSPQVAQQVAQELQRSGGAGFFVQDWTQLNKDLWDAIALEKNVYFLVLLLIIVMASFSIVTTLVMIVIEKRKDIAVLKTLGASSWSIAGIFCFQGTVIGALGTTLGLMGGYAGCLLLREYGFPLPEGVFPTATVPVKLETLNFVVVGLAAFGISALSTLYPAWRASQLKPSEVLRYE